MSLVWKLLRQHVSVPQLAGFFFANLFGMLIILVGYQFYRDALPVFTSEDSFMKPDYLIISKKIGTTTTLSGQDNTFTQADMDELRQQPFVRKVGKFTTADYQVSVTVGLQGNKVLDSEFFLESIPDEFVRVQPGQWIYEEGSPAVPIILPRSYIAMYNFGYARSHSLPKISEGIAGTLDVRMRVHGNGKTMVFKGKVIGFSGRLNAILVPAAFMSWSNQHFATGAAASPNRLIVDASNPADASVSQYLDSHGYDVEDSNRSAEKTAYFLRLVVSIVMAIGLVISILSFYILMLSIYLLVQKNARKLENLLLIGYSPMQVARPYILLTLALNLSVWGMAMLILLAVRHYYIQELYTLLPSIDKGSLWPAFLLGLTLLVLVSCINALVLFRKMLAIWKHKE